MAEQENNQEQTQGQSSVQIDEGAIAEKAKSESRKEMAEFQKAFAEDPQFAIEQFVSGVTLEKAKANYAEVLKNQNDELQKEKAELEKKTKAKNAGEEPIKQDGEGGSQTDNFLEAAKQLARDEKITVTEAMKRIRKENPQLYEEYRNSGKQQ